MTQTTTINRIELQALKQRISEAQAYGLSLSQEDNQHILDALMTLEHLQQQLHTHSITLHKLRKSLGIEMSSEKLRDLCGESSRARTSWLSHLVSVPLNRKAPHRRPSSIMR